MSDQFIFKTEARIIPKRFEAILPSWEKLLAELDIELDTTNAMEININAISATFEDELVALLDEQLLKIKEYTLEQKRDYLTNHEPLKLALARAQVIVASRA